MPFISGRLYTGQVTGITNTPVMLGDGTLPAIREVMIQADATNVGNLIVGNGVNQFVTLTPGQAITVPIVSLTLVYVKMSTGTGIANWLARD